MFLCFDFIFLAELSGIKSYISEVGKFFTSSYDYVKNAPPYLVFNYKDNYSQEHGQSTYHSSVWVAGFCINAVVFFDVFETLIHQSTLTSHVSYRCGKRRGYVYKFDGIQGWKWKLKDNVEINEPNGNNANVCVIFYERQLKGKLILPSLVIAIKW